MCQKHRDADRYWRNVEASRAARRELYRSQPDRERLWKQGADRERAKESSAAWRAANAGKVRDSWYRRKARKLGNGFERISWAGIVERDGMTCHICEAPIESKSDLHFDHVIPLSKGGPHSMENIRPAHAKCNLRKSNKLI
jgi:hypothetical protein